MKYRSLESLRGIAALIVALFHSQFIVGSKPVIVAQGEVFVDFFFILSGFVMAYAYLDKISDGIKFKDFFLLRFGRLYPLHLFMLLVWLPYILAKGFAFYRLGMGSDPFLENSAFSFATNLLLINSLGIHDSLSWNFPAWSISVEFFTYMIFFLFVVTVKPKAKWVVFLYCSLSAYLCLFLVTDTTLLSTYKYGILRCVGGFFLGVFLLKASNKISVSPNKISASIAEIAVVAGTLFLVSQSADNKIVQLILFAVFGVLIIIFSVQERGIISRVLRTKFLLLTGTLSYSIYMLHAIVFSVLADVFKIVLKMPITVIMQDGVEVDRYFDTGYANLINLFALVLIIALSYLTYRFVETPWRQKFRALAGRDLPQRSNEVPDPTVRTGTATSSTST